MSVRIASPTGFEITGPLRSVDDPPVLVADVNGPRDGRDLGDKLDLRHDTTARAMRIPYGTGRRPITKHVRRLREYLRGEIIAPNPSSSSCVLSDHVGETMTSLDPAICAIGSRYISSQHFARYCLVECPKARTRSSESSGSRSPLRVQCSGELHVRLLDKAGGAI